MSDDVRVYVAQIYAPGYLPESDTPGFPTAHEAWAYLASERMRGEDEAEGGGSYSDECTIMESYGNPSYDYSVDPDDHRVTARGVGYIGADTPGYDGDHDLGLIYRVSAVRHADYPHLPGYLSDCRACEAMCHCVPDSAECVYMGDHN